MLQSGWRCWPVLCFAMFRECRDVSRRLRCGVVPESAESWRRRVPFCRRFATPTTPTAPLLRLKQVRWVCRVWLRCSKPPCRVHDDDRLFHRGAEPPASASKTHGRLPSGVTGEDTERATSMGANPFVLVMRGFCDFTHFVQFPVGQQPSVATGEDTTLETSRGPILSSW